MTEASYATVRNELMYPNAGYFNEAGEECESDDDDATYKQGDPVMSGAKADALLTKHKDLLDRGIRLLSAAYYVAGEILKAESAAQQAGNGPNKTPNP